MSAVKRAISLILCIILISCVLPAAQASEDTAALLEYNSWENSDTNIPKAQRYADIDENSGYGFYYGLFIDYTVVIENDGWYQIDMLIGGEAEENTAPAISLYIDDIPRITEAEVADSGFKAPENNSIAELFLQKGSYSFRIIAESGVMQFFKMSLTFSGVDDGKKALELVYAASVNTVTGGGDARIVEGDAYDGIILGTSTSYAEHSVNVPEGNYILSICYGANETDGRAAVSVNGAEEEIYTLPKNNTWIMSSTFERTAYYDMGVISLEKGSSTIKIRCEKTEDENSDAYFSYSAFKLRKITEPVVQLYSGNETVSSERIYELRNGIMSIQSYLPSYAKGSNITFIAAVYKNNKLYKTAMAYNENTDANTILKTSIEDIELSSGSNYECRFYHWKDLDGLQPLYKAQTLEKIYKNLYIAENGSDSASGTISEPFLTLSRAKEEIAKINDDMDGDIIVNILPGTYKLNSTEVFTDEHSGKNGYRVILRGTDYNNKPVFSGGTKITGWEKYTDYIWKAPYDGGTDIRNLYVNGYMAQKARSKYRYMPTEDFILDGSTNISDGVAITEINFPKSFARPQDLELCWQNSWAFQITPVKDVFRENGMAYFVMDQPYYNMARSKQLKSTAPGANRRFHIQNAMELLDEPGEFYYNKEEKFVYYYPFKNENMEQCETVVGTTELMLSVAGSSKQNRAKNIVFENLNIKYGAWNEASETGIIVDQADKTINTLNSEAGHGGRMIPAQLDIKDADGITVRNCEFSCLGSSAIAMSDGVSNSLIEGNSIHDISGSGIVIGHWDHNASHTESAELTQCRNIDILNNAIVRAAYEFKGCCGISVYYEKNINILNNYLKDLPYTGITLGWGWGEEADFGNIKVSFNRIENCIMPPVLDGGHIYTLGPLRGSEISYNYLTGTESRYGAIYPDSGSSEFEIHHNVVEGCEHWFFGGLYETHDITAYDNYSDTSVYYDYGNEKEFGENFIEKVNLVADDNWPKEAADIINNAGLNANYKHLAETLSYPSWRTDFAKSAPESVFKVYDDTWYEAEDYNDGGQEVGYYKLRPLGNNTVYRKGDVILYEMEDSGDVVVGDTYPGEWLLYNIEVAEDADYQITIKGSYGDTSEGSLQPRVNIYIDGELIAEEKEIQTTESWGINLDNIIGEYFLRKGIHTVKIEFVDNGFSFDSFRILNAKLKDVTEETSPDYDEGILVIEK